MILKQQNTESVTDGSNRVMFITRISDTLAKEHDLLHSLFIIPHYAFHFMSTDFADKPHS